MATENHHHPHPGSMPVEEAIEATANWRSYLSSSNSEFNLQSFWISIDKIKSLLEHHPDADGIRVYLGLENAANPTSFKIVTVPTQNRVDVIELSNGESIVLPPPIYCPPVCPTGCILNG